MKTKVESFLENFYKPCESGHYQNDIKRIMGMTEPEYDDFEEKIGYFMEDPGSYIREFAIDPKTLESVVCNRCYGIHSIAKKELLAKICLSENLGTNQKNERMDEFISGLVFFDMGDFKIPILKITSGCRQLETSAVKQMILLATESKQIIFLDLTGRVITS